MDIVFVVEPPSIVFEVNQGGLDCVVEPAGLPGPKGDAGAPGPAGPGLPPGGAAGQVLSKASDLDQDTAWTDPPTPGAASWDDLTGKPEAFPPEAHGHALADVAGFPEALEGKENAGAAAAAVAAHEAAEDPHPQYATGPEAAAVASSAVVSHQSAPDPHPQYATAADASAVAASAVSAHQGAADPHPQYATPAEAADAAPVQSVAGKTGLVVLTLADISGLQPALEGKEPAIAVKGSAFNKDFGTTAGTVCQGNDARLSDARTPLAHGHAIADVVALQAALDAKAALAHNHDALYAALSHVGAGAAAHALATASAAGFVPAYEEGAWTPVLAGDGAAGSNTYDATNTGGRYVRIGRLVFVHGRVKVTAVSGMTGNLIIKGLPFALAAVGGFGHAMTTSGINGLSGVASGNVPVGVFANSVDRVYLQMQSNTGLTLVSTTQCVAGTDVYISGSYIKG